MKISIIKTKTTGTRPKSNKNRYQPLKTLPMSFGNCFSLIVPVTNVEHTGENKEAVYYGSEAVWQGSAK